MKNHKILVSGTVAFFVLSVIGGGRAWPQNGVIGFRNACDSRAYVMRGQAESTTNPRVALPLPSAASGNQGRFPYDISTTGPVTVLLNGLYAVQVNESLNGGLSPDPAVSIQLDLAAYPDLPLDINHGFGRFSPTGDRIALVADGILVIADIVRDATTQKITGLTNPTIVANLADVGSPSDSNVTTAPFIGWPDFSPDGHQILVTIYSDLWLLTLMNDGHTLASSRPLTRTLNDPEFESAFSPDGTAIAYIAGPNSGSRRGVSGPSGQSLSIFKLDLATLSVTQLAKNTSLVGTEWPAWSPDSQFLAFMAQGSPPPRNSPCAALVNYDLYEIKANGTGAATPLSKTVGTGAEYFSQWGW